MESNGKNSKCKNEFFLVKLRNTHGKNSFDRSGAKNSTANYWIMSKLIDLIISRYRFRRRKMQKKETDRKSLYRRERETETLLWMSQKWCKQVYRWGRGGYSLYCKIKRYIRIEYILLVCSSATSGRKGMTMGGRESARTPTTTILNKNVC